MKKIAFSTAVSALALMVTTLPSAAGNTFDPICVASTLINSVVGDDEPAQAVKVKYKQKEKRVAFCGQCTKDDDCGTCKCKGPSDGSCNECVCD